MTYKMADFLSDKVTLLLTIFLSVIAWGYGEEPKLVYTAIVRVTCCVVCVHSLICSSNWWG